MRVTVKTRAGAQWAVGRELQRHILAEFERAGIKLPYPRQEVWLLSETRAGEG